MHAAARRISILCLLTLCLPASCGVSSTLPPTAKPTTMPIMAATSAPATPTPIVVVVTATPQPSGSPVPQTNLEEPVSAWSIFTEGAPTAAIRGVELPSIDGMALQCSLLGGAPYSNVHCYRNLPPAPNANQFTLSLAFWFTAEQSCANEGTPSVVQALEFTVSTWQRGQRYELALQWQNIGDGAPQWRYWTPGQAEPWQPIVPPIQQCLEPNRWHTIALSGSIVGQQVQYDRLIIDAQEYPLNLTAPVAPTPGEPDRLAVAVQLDGNANTTPYDLVIDQVRLVALAGSPEPLPTATPTPSPSPTSTPTSRPTRTPTPIPPTSTPPPPPPPTLPPDCAPARIDRPDAETVPPSFRITWTPALCTMVLQYYQNERLIFEDRSATSGQYDLSGIALGRTEIKIWAPGTSKPSDSLFVLVQ